MPLTPAGLAVLVGALWAWYALGIDRGDLVIRTLASAALAVVALTSISTLVAALRLRSVLHRRRSTPEPLELEVGHPGHTGFRAKVALWLPLVDARATWTSPPVHHELVRLRGSLTEKVTPLRRGEFSGIEREITVEDHLGLSRVRFRSLESRRIRFVPSVGALKNIQVVQGMAAGDGMAHPDGPPSGDPMDIRHYGAGDPIRYVLWKVFAKSRTLVVRTPERAISPEQKTVAYLVSADGDQAAAGAARVAIETTALGNRWKLGCDGCDEGADTRQHALELIVQSARTTPSESGAGLGPFLHNLEGNSRRAVVFVPPVPGPWLERVLAVCGPQAAGGAQIDFVVCTDGIASPAPQRAGLLFRPLDTTQRAADPEALGEVLRRLSGAGSLKVLDRTTGQLHPESHLTALLRRAS